MESHYEKARRLSTEAQTPTGDDELPSVDWGSYRDKRLAQYDTLPQNLRPEAYEAERGYNVIRKYQQDKPYVSTPLDEIYHPYGKQQEEIDTARQKVNKVVTRHPLPNGLQMEHNYHEDLYGGPVHVINLIDPHNTSVGTLSWAGRDGHVGGFYVERGYRNYVPHMLDAAHSLSGAYGHVGPNHSGTLSRYSHALIKKYSPSSMPDYAEVNGVPVREYEEPRIGAIHKHLDDIHQEIDESSLNFPSGHPTNHSHNEAGYAVTDAISSLYEGNYLGVRAGLHTALGHLQDIQKELGPEPSERDEYYSSRQIHVPNAIEGIHKAHSILDSMGH